MPAKLGVGQIAVSRRQNTLAAQKLMISVGAEILHVVTSLVREKRREFLDVFMGSLNGFLRISPSFVMPF